MRKIFLLMNVSLDGYFQDTKGDISWSHNDDAEAFKTGESDEVDTLLFGHTTYNMMKAFWPTPQASESQPDIAKFMNAAHKLVASHKPFDPGWKNVTVLSGDDVVEQVRKIKGQPGKTIGIFGSNKLLVDLMDADLVDEFQIIINPVALGEGTPMFKGLHHPQQFKLTETKKFKSGQMFLRYERADA